MDDWREGWMIGGRDGCLEGGMDDWREGWMIGGRDG